MVERAVGLSTPQLVGGHLKRTEAVTFLPHVCHEISPTFDLRSLLSLSMRWERRLLEPIFRLVFSDIHCVWMKKASQMKNGSERRPRGKVRLPRRKPAPPRPPPPPTPPRSRH